jgi:hypothetical protein
MSRADCSGAPPVVFFQGHQAFGDRVYRIRKLNSITDLLISVVLRRPTGRSMRRDAAYRYVTAVCLLSFLIRRQLCLAEAAIAGGGPIQLIQKR